MDELKIVFTIFLTLSNKSTAASGLTQVINMLCAKYNYKMDIAVKKQEAFEDGLEQKAIEAATILVKDFNTSPEIAAKKMNAPLEKVLAVLNN